MATFRRHKKTTSIFLAISLTGCVAGNPAHHPEEATDTTNKRHYQAASSHDPNQQPVGVPPSATEQEGSNPTITDFDGKKPPRFDLAPDFSDAEVVPGEVTVIFRDSFKVRETASQKTVTALDKAAVENINFVLSRFGLTSASDYSGNQDEASLDADEKKVEEYWGADIPHMKSIFSFKFPANADTKAAALALRGLPTVLTAYRTPKITPAAPILVKRWTFASGDLAGAKPSDAEFTRSSENTNSSGYFQWYWFNRHKVFHAWNVYGSTALPTVAVVDTGFDTRTTTSPAAFDQPTYDSTYCADIDGTGTKVGTTLASVQEPSTKTWSHGTWVAGILASPKNSQGFCGVLPGTTLIPIRTTFSSQSMSEAIRYSYYGTGSNCYTTNVSAQLGFKPIVWDLALKTAIAYATGNGSSVVICAGNGYKDLDAADPNKPTDDAGAIIVGGVNMSGSVSGTTGFNWRNTSISSGLEGAGSSYGSFVHVAASAENIAGPTYNPSTNSSGYLVQASGTSGAVPMVAATAAMVRSLINANGGSSTPAKVRNVIFGSSTLMKSHDGNLYGYLLNNTYNPGGNNGIRCMNMANAFYMAKMPVGQPIVRVFNVDDNTWWTKNYNWSGIYSQEDLSYDTIFDIRSDSFTTSDNLAFSTYNGGGARSHGYQVWRNGILVDETLGGASEYRTPWGSITGTVGEDSGSTITGWNYTVGFPALR